MRTSDALDMVRLSGEASRKPAQLSGGQRQRVALARALIGRPRVLLLDEPLGALDLKLREQMQIELKEIQREVGITFVIVTHDQDEALTLCDRLAVFNDGARIEQVGRARDVSRARPIELVMVLLLFFVRRVVARVAALPSSTASSSLRLEESLRDHLPPEDRRSRPATVCWYCSRP